MLSPFKKRIIRKTLLLAFLALAGILGGEVYQLLTEKTTEEVLHRYNAQQLTTQSLTVNGSVVIADIWQLPDFVSPDVLKKTRGKALTVNRLVYVFKDDITHSKGQCRYPSDLPALDITCDYVVDATHSRFVSGTSPANAATLRSSLEASARAQGWTVLNPNLFRKGRDTLFLSLSEGRDLTQIAIIVRKNLQ